MIHESLGTGKENAQTGKELALMHGCNIRDVTAQIERERRNGRPICASSGDSPGYYLAADADELEAYCNQLKRRAIQLFKTRQALINTLRQIRDKREEQQ